MRGDKSQPTIIIGAGLAGLYTALKLAPHPVTVIAAAPLGMGASSAWAQGGIAAAVSESDTPQAHARDTIAAGDGLVDETIAHLVAREAPDRIRDLLNYGVPFDRDLEGHFVLSREAAHSAKRVVRVAGDGAGKAIMEALISAARATPSITILEGYEAQALTVEGDNGTRHGSARVSGAVLTRADDPAAIFRLTGLSAVVLATGGVGALYALTTNPSHARGDGIAMAAQIGAVVADAEFVQFHPTAIDTPADPTPLATEALRGEGAVLINEAGERFMQAIHPDAEMAPRNVVARAVFRERQDGARVYLDCSQAIGAAFRERFPTVYAQCISAGIDPSIEPIPVAPAAHYHMGGLKTDAHARTNVPGLWAVGEIAASGLHGANRLASNSLLEAVVFGARAAQDIAKQTRSEPQPVNLVREPTDHLPDFGARGAGMAMIRETMSRFAGVERDSDGLKSALGTLGAIAARADGDRVVTNAATTAKFIVEAALRRKETRGGHYRSDFPQKDPSLARHRTMTLAGLELRESLSRGELNNILQG